MRLRVSITAAALIVLALIGAGAATATDAVVIVAAAGEAYKGAPIFRLLADGRLIGKRQLRKSVDTTSGRNLSGSELGDHLEWFEFSVPSVEAVTKLEIQFLNDAWAGEGNPGDRNLYIIAVSVNGYRFGSSELIPVTEDAEGAEITQKWVALWGSGSVQLPRPEIGWRKGYKAQ